LIITAAARTILEWRPAPSVAVIAAAVVAAARITVAPVTIGGALAALVVFRVGAAVSVAQPVAAAVIITAIARFAAIIAVPFSMASIVCAITGSVIAAIAVVAVFVVGIRVPAMTARIVAAPPVIMPGTAKIGGKAQFAASIGTGIVDLLDNRWLG